MTHSTLRVLFSVLAVVGLLTGCKKPRPKAAPRAPVPVAVARATGRDIPTRLEAIGLVHPLSTVMVKSLVGGQLESANFNQGDEVHRGQTLFEIDPKPYQTALEQAQANLARDVASDTQAQEEAHRYTELSKQGISSEEQRQQFEAVAKAADSVVRADQAAVDTAKLNLSYCTIKSPIEGRTGALLVHPGNVVQANASILVSINQIKPIYVAFSVPEQHLLELKTLNERHSVTVIASANGHAEQGTLSFINNTIDTNTDTIRLMAVFANKDQRLWPGEYVDAHVTLSVQTNATVVPASAVLIGQKDSYVYVVTSKGTVEDRPVAAGTTADGMTVISHGITLGETVVTDGQLALYPGARVVVRPPVSDKAGTPEE